MKKPLLNLLVITAVVCAGCAGRGKSTGTPSPKNRPLGRCADTEWYTSIPDAVFFRISAPCQLAGLAKLVNGGVDDFKGKTITMTADIDLSEFGEQEPWNGGKGWTPVGGAEGRLFSGTFYGDGYKVTGLFINDTCLEYAGLFGHIGVEGTVREVGVEGVDITGGRYAGGIAGGSYGSVINSYCKGKVRGKVSVGGIVGIVKRTAAGGEAGGISGGVGNCYFEGAAVGIGKRGECDFDDEAAGGVNVGGIAGSVLGGPVVHSYSIGKVSGGYNAGGVAGYVDRGLLSCNYSTSTVNGGVNAGGIAGLIEGNDGYGLGSMVSNYSAGAVSAKYHAGGLAGYLKKGAIIYQSAALNPSVTATDSAAGRIFGSRDGITGGLVDNAAFSGMTVQTGDAKSQTGFDGETKDGIDITAKTIAADGTIGGRFMPEVRWVIQNGKLPGLIIDLPVELPEHLRVDFDIDIDVDIDADVEIDVDVDAEL